MTFMSSDKRGSALIFVLYVLIVCLILSSIFIFRSVNESNLARLERDMAKSFYYAEGGANSGLDSLEDAINTDLYNTINGTSPQAVKNDITKNCGGKTICNVALDFLVKYAKEGTKALFTSDGTQATYTINSTNVGEGSYQYNIVVTQKSNPLAVQGQEEVWDLPFYYRVESTGNRGSVSKEVLFSGDFTITIQHDNFAKYALFTDHHQMESGKTVWFTNKTNFAGPVHTNDNFSFALNPSGTFDGAVTQQNTKAQFFNQGQSILADADSNPPYDVPTFNAGYTRGVSEIVLESSIEKQDLSEQATGGQNFIGDGIFLANDGQNLTGGIFIRGDPTISMGVNGTMATYTVKEGTTTKTIKVDKDNNRTVVSESGLPDATYNGVPDGVDDVGTIIYVDGTVNSLGGTIQKDTEVTISSEFDIVITNNIRYESYTPAVGNPGDSNYVAPDAGDAVNLLGILSWGGDVRIGTSAPDNLDIHGIVMARNGVFSVDNYDDKSVGARGTATLLGGAITQFYGAFGLFDGSTGQNIAGYGRNFVYDDRTLSGKAPPYFPSLKNFIAFTNDITDKIVWQEG